MSTIKWEQEIYAALRNEACLLEQHAMDGAAVVLPIVAAAYAEGERAMQRRAIEAFKATMVAKYGSSSASPAYGFDGLESIRALPVEAAPQDQTLGTCAPTKFITTGPSLTATVSSGMARALAETPLPRSGGPGAPSEEGSKK